MRQGHMRYMWGHTRGDVVLQGASRYSSIVYDLVFFYSIWPCILLHFAYIFVSCIFLQSYNYRILWNFICIMYLFKQILGLIYSSIFFMRLWNFFKKPILCVSCHHCILWNCICIMHLIKKFTSLMYYSILCIHLLESFSINLFCVYHATIVDYENIFALCILSNISRAFYIIPHFVYISKGLSKNTMITDHEIVFAWCILSNNS